MTPADCGTTAHQDRTAQVRIAGRADRSAPCRNGYVDTLPICAAVETSPKAGKESGEPAPLELPPDGINNENKCTTDQGIAQWKAVNTTAINREPTPFVAPFSYSSAS